MTAPHADQLTDGYLARLSDAARDLPRGPRRELIDDMRAHIAEARARETGEETDATILNILDRLGEPSVVVAEARERLGIRPAQPFRPGVLEVFALVLLPFVWPIGVILLWISPAWNTRDKILGSLLPPGGYPLLLYFGAAVAVSGGSCSSGGASSGQVIQQSCSPGSPAWQVVGAIILSVVLAILPLATAAYLAVRLRWGRRMMPSPA
jgi:hypothetical protein